MSLITIKGLGKIDPHAQLRDLDRTEFEDSLYLFLRAAWPNIDGAPWIDGWCIEAVAEHLEAVVDGEIKRLMINIPPRCSKSSLCSIAFPAWVWAQREVSPTSGPGVPFLAVSYGTRLAETFSGKCRRLIQSPWYQSYWGDRFQLLADQNAKTRFGNDKHGERLLTSVTAGTTGEGGNIIIVDDANEAGEANSEAVIQTTNEYWDESLSSRLNDQRTGAFVVIQQRLSENDLTGHILEADRGEWTHLVLPMRYEAERSFVTSIGWKDPRQTDGQLLWPERFGPEVTDALERTLGPYGFAGQYQQRPTPRGGGVIHREWWLNWPEENFPPMDYILASLDTAYTEKTENDFSALTVWGVFTADTKAQVRRLITADGRITDAGRARAEEQIPNVMLMTAWQDRLALHDLVKKTAETCKKLKVDLLLIENKAAGVSVAQELRRLYQNEDFGVQLHDPKNIDKLSRLYSVQHLFAEGMIYAPDRAWADMVITQVESFPRGKHDDLVDTVSQALRKLRDMGLLIRGPERLAEISEAKQYRPQPKPLYPA